MKPNIKTKTKQKKVPTQLKRGHYKKINVKTSMLLRALHQEAGVSCPELVKRYPQFSERSIYRHAKSTSDTMASDKRKNNKGRPKKLTLRDERNIIRTLHKLREERASFTARCIQDETKLHHVSLKSIYRVLRKHGYRYRQSRKKGLLSQEDKRNRLRFAREALKLPSNFWTETVTFYLDGVGFTHKRNPYAEARAVSSMAWRLPGEGLSVTTKGRKEGSNGEMANFFVAIAYKKGVVMCKQYPWRVTGERFAKFIENVFPSVFENCDVEMHGSLWLQDGDPRQNAKIAKTSWEKLGTEMYEIPARSPDINPIENIFHIVRNQLKENALQQKIKNESYTEFSKRVADTISSVSSELIDKTIASMTTRLKHVIMQRGGRTKY